MPRIRTEVVISSRDYWYKALENHQTNWALIESDAVGGECTVFFFHELSGVFDRLAFASTGSAESELHYNGFRRLLDDGDVPWADTAPKAPFYEDTHPNGPIYSSGRYWQTPPKLEPE